MGLGFRIWGTWVKGCLKDLRTWGYNTQTLGQCNVRRQGLGFNVVPAAVSQLCKRETNNPTSSLAHPGRGGLKP